MGRDRPAPKDAITSSPEYQWGSFPGYQRISWTPIPDELLDHQMTRLSNSELRVFLYILRKTAGWKKDVDAISIDQMLHGVRTEDGREIDDGAGVSKPALLKALRDLEDKGMIVRERDRDAEHGHLPTRYSLRYSGEPLVKPVDLPLVKTVDQGLVKPVDLPLVSKATPQEISKQEITTQEINPTHNTTAEEVVLATVRRAGLALQVSLQEQDVALLTARIKYFLSKKPDPEYVVSIAEECRAEYRRKGRAVTDWVKLYLSFLASRLEEVETRVSETSPNGHSEPSPASPPTGTAFYDDALVPWLRHLSTSGKLPARSVNDNSFEDLRAVSFDGAVLVLSKPEDFHSYNARAWPVTMQRVADERLGREIAVTWQEESHGPTGEPDKASADSNGHRPGTEAKGVVERHAGRRAV